MKRKLKKWLRNVFILLVMLLGLTYVFQEKLIFLPTVLEADYQYDFPSHFEEINLTAQDGATLNGLHFKVENPKGVILYFHGNAGDLSRWGNVVQVFVERQYDVVVMDYRTYGKSTGKLGEKVLYDDAQLWYNYTSRFFESDQIVCYGRSLGASIATKLASKVSVKQLVLETPFYHLEDAANYRFWFLPTKTLLRYKFETNNYIQMVTCPKHFILSEEDDVVSFASGQKLFEISPEPKTRLKIKDATHNNVASFNEYHDFLNKIL